jgi:hypothetical protein
MLEGMTDAKLMLQISSIFVFHTFNFIEWAQVENYISTFQMQVVKSTIVFIPIVNIRRVQNTFSLNWLRLMAAVKMANKNRKKNQEDE